MKEMIMNTGNKKNLESNHASFAFVSYDNSLNEAAASLRGKREESLHLL